MLFLLSTNDTCTRNESFDAMEIKRRVFEDEIYDISNLFHFRIPSPDTVLHGIIDNIGTDIRRIS